MDLSRSQRSTSTSEVEEYAEEPDPCQCKSACLTRRKPGSTRGCPCRGENRLCTDACRCGTKPCQNKTNQQKPSGGLFGTATQQGQTTGGVSFGATTVANNPSSSGGFTFASAAPSGSTGFSFGSGNATTTAQTLNPAGSTQGGLFGSVGGGFQFPKPATTGGTVAGPQPGVSLFSSIDTSGFSFGGTSKPATQPATTGGLNLGSVPQGTSGFTFGMSAPAASSASTGFTLGSGTTPTAGGFNLGKTTAATATPALTLGGTQMPSTGLLGSTLGTFRTQTSGLTLGQPASQGFTLGGGTTATAAAVTAAPAAFTFGAATSSAAPSGLNLGGSSGTSTGNSGFTLGGKAPGTTPSIGFSFGSSINSGIQPTSTAATTAPSGSGFSLGPQPGTVVLGSTAFGGNLAKTTASAVATTTATGLSLGFKPPTTSSIITTSAPGLSLGGTGGIKLGSLPTTTSLSTATTTVASVSGAIASSTSGPGTAPAGAAINVPQLTYKQLEEHINKWALELEDHERTFLDQASQVNSWDRLLMENGEKITELNANVEGVKAEQKRLDQELDFIMAQQKELEEMLKPLEEAVSSSNVGSRQLQQADKERDLTYKLAKDIDGQLKQMVQDLKSIIDHLNSANTQQQDTEDPIAQIAKILNAHMDSLQWIDQNSNMLQRKVEEITRLNDTRRKEQERNFRLAFE